jgi:hypothetical protein
MVQPLAAQMQDVDFLGNLLIGFYSCSAFKSSFVLGQCPVNRNIPAPKHKIANFDDS